MQPEQSCYSEKLRSTQLGLNSLLGALNVFQWKELELWSRDSILTS
jgi:hypothetical protein